MAIERVELPKQSRRKREYDPRFIIIHTTRGAPAAGEYRASNQYSGTINWMKQGGNNQPNANWGPSCDILIGSKGEECFFTLNGEDFHRTRANWSAGYGSGLTYGADEHGISIEVAQTWLNEPVTKAALETLVKRCAYLCITYDIKPKRIRYLSQEPGDVPNGLVGHEDTANGKLYGKTDPGNRFPWDWFIEALTNEIRKRTVKKSKHLTRIQLIMALLKGGRVIAQNQENGKDVYKVTL